MNISLKGKNALIGGSSRGIGKAIAEQLAESGASVTLMSRSEEKLQKIIADLPTDQGQNHGYLVVDFTDFQSYSKTIYSFFENNHVDILINNTQGPEAGGALEKDISDYQEAFDLLFKTVVYTTELALKHMKANTWGRIINVASVSVKEPLSYLALSNTIRAAVVTWGKSLANDVGPFQITVNSILTGYFNTERIEQLNAKKAEQLGISEDDILADMEAKVPVRRIGDPKEYGYLVTFLASDNAAYITGTQIPIDGGLLKSL
ncbi:SDR family oxidoreductase [Maribacter polysiphoniae]|uniref:3-oxoacyl-[acyl-carrier protein] reductase n=1 Tax=Maribacter polysiphoniae TaxID=429344 RepID=A0A316E6D0_9FLAO|nr:SDR family oxidoreductase [Maribacter polysiphoniae]MBD1259517.1 SDR family oxidoreductase [Maribacter polysiphoniae]PWK25082.1 3-oxoacyl-[acyl-carrier protein] reductase [Maribacter polysiphoniae]